MTADRTAGSAAVCKVVLGPFPFPRHGKGPRNEVNSVLFRSATSLAIYFFCLLSNAFPDFGSVGRSIGEEKKPKNMEKKSRTRRPSTSA